MPHGVPGICFQNVCFVCLILIDVIKFGSDLLQVDGFLCVIMFS
jgi:hypothetical protein